MISEKAFGSQVESLAKIYGWRYYHTWRSIHSPAGYPDYCLVRPPRIVYAELKTETGKLTLPQEEWINLLKECGGNVEAYVWRPADIEKIVEVLE